MRRGFKWSPWRGQRDATQPADGEDEREDEPTPALRAWRLAGDALRVAAYYRVMHSDRRARDRRRHLAAKERFQRWIRSCIEQRRAEAAAKEHGQAAEAERQRRGERVSGATRMQRTPADVYRDTRRYKPRAAAHDVERRLLSKAVRPRIIHAAEIGPRLYDNLREIADRCARARIQRQRGDG